MAEGPILSTKKFQTTYLVLEDATVFKGISMGVYGETVGEVVYNTCTASYHEILNDPTYYGQIVAQTFPLVGNRRVIETEEPSKICANGYIVREWCDTPDSSRDGNSLDGYLNECGIVGISGIDTRCLTRKLRDKGYFKGAITPTIERMDDVLSKIREFSVRNAVHAVSIKQAEVYSTPDAEYHISILDYGFSRQMLKSLLRRQLSVTIFPASTPPEKILKAKPNGIVLPNGPGDPDDDMRLIAHIAALINAGIPILAIGLGHQMLALATGMSVKKMLTGHRGSNQPVRIVDSDKVMITSQNHGYDVSLTDKNSVQTIVTMRHVHDDSVEGLLYPDIPAYSVQFQPDDHEGYSDSAWVYDCFLNIMRGVDANG